MGVKTRKVKFTASPETPHWKDRFGGDKMGNWKDGEVNEMPEDVAIRRVANLKCFSFADQEDKMQRGTPDNKSAPKKKPAKKTAKKKLFGRRK